jgi:hypothetical protein
MAKTPQPIIRLTSPSAIFVLAPLFLVPLSLASIPPAPEKPRDSLAHCQQPDDDDDDRPVAMEHDARSDDSELGQPNPHPDCDNDQSPDYRPYHTFLLYPFSLDPAFCLLASSF